MFKTFTWYSAEALCLLLRKALLKSAHTGHIRHALENFGPQSAFRTDAKPDYLLVSLQGLVFVQVEHPSEVMNHLTRITRRQLNKMLMQVHAAAPKFSYVPKFTDPPNAINSIVSAMCSKQDQFPPQNVA